MFERYTERARRVIFFARYEAAQFGSTTIETEHFLLGLIREDKNLTQRFLSNASAIESIRSEVEGRTTISEKASTSMDLPLSNECKRILAYAAEEAERLNHRHIGTEHLLLGILREERCLAARMLQERGLQLDTIREELACVIVDRHQGRAEDEQWPPGEVAVPDAVTAKRIAEAIWRPAYAGGTSGGVPEVELVNANIWRIVAGPLFAFIRAMDGKVLAMGMGQTGESNV